MKISTKKIVFTSVIAAIYAVLTIILKPISYGPLQIRISEALTVLPFFSSFSILGLTIGCFISNIFGDVGMLDIIFGPIATLLSAILTYLIGKSNFKFSKFLAPIPPIVINGIVVGKILNYTQNFPLIPTMLWVGFGELIACYIIGLPLMSLIEKNPKLKSYLT
ncbi:Uncharacterized membrane protein [Clostridium sp. USBA 49]|jgi:uncharacterized membrane protein|uniref:QueT transporter family protein n=1 Tax=Clostridium sp. USBA 49 TaxID=1881060 RepID=UPI000999B775|nr:QueT transporter family protein [Clostridium sp. USBA 49]SKA72907.1 Uncharacterized membrane protein [Clostridium sp. USBA 49]